MKKILLLTLLLPVFAKAQIRSVMYMDSVGQIHICAVQLPQVAISGYYSNLIGIPASFPPPAMTVLAKSANYTILVGDFGSAKVLYVPVDCTSGSVTITMPSASAITGYQVVITKTDATANTVTISGLTGDNVIGTQKWSKELLSDGTNIRQN